MAWLLDSFNETLREEEAASTKKLLAHMSYTDDLLSAYRLHRPGVGQDMPAFSVLALVASNTAADRAVLRSGEDDSSPSGSCSHVF